MWLAGVKKRTDLHHRRDLRFLTGAAFHSLKDPRAGAALRDAILLDSAAYLPGHLTKYQKTLDSLSASEKKALHLAVLVRAEDQLEIGRPKRALELINWNLDRPGPHLARAFVLLGDIRTETFDQKGSTWAYRRALEQRKAGESTKPKPTLAEFRAALTEESKTDVAARLSLTRLDRATRELSQQGALAAIHTITRIVRLNPEGRIPLAHLYAKLGKESKDKGNSEKVFSFLKAALNLDAQNVLAHRILGDYYLDTKSNWKSARFHYRTALKSLDLLKD